MCIIHIYIYIYVYTSLSLSLYIYIYTYVHYPRPVRGLRGPHRPQLHAPDRLAGREGGDCKGTNGVSANGATANFIFVDIFFGYSR